MCSDAAFTEGVFIFPFFSLSGVTNMCFYLTRSTASSSLTPTSSMSSHIVGRPLDLLTGRSKLSIPPPISLHHFIASTRVHQLFSYMVTYTPLQSYTLSPTPQGNNTTPFDLSCTTPSAPSKQTSFIVWLTSFICL